MLLSGAFKSIIVRIVSAAALLGMHVLLAQLMAAADYGAYNFVLAIVGLLALLVQFGLDKSSIRFIPQAASKGDYRAMSQFINFSVKWIVVASAIVLGLMYILIPLLDIDEPMSKGLTVGLLMLPGLALLQFWQQVLRSLKQIAASQIFEQIVVPLLVGLLAALVFVLGFDLDITWAALIHLLVVSIAALGVWRRFHATKEMTIRVKDSVHKAAVAEWLSVSIPLGIAGLMSFILSRGELIVLGLLLSAEDVATYSVALRLTNLIIFGLAAANAIGAPVFSEMYQGRSKRELQAAVSQTAAIALLMSAPAILVILIFPEMLLTIFGDEYVSAKLPLLILLLGNVVNVVSGPVGPLLTISGEQNFYLRVMAVAMVIKLALLIPAAINFGVVGVAWSAALVTVVWNIWLAAGAYFRLGIIPLPIPTRR